MFAQLFGRSAKSLGSLFKLYAIASNMCQVYALAKPQ